MATWLRVPPGIIGLTVAAFATSSPELAVSLSAARQGDTAIALGNALGSNVVNIGLILGIALIIAPLTVPKASTRRDDPMAVLAPVLTLALALDGVLWPGRRGRLLRWRGVLLVALYAAYLAAVIQFPPPTAPQAAALPRPVPAATAR
jgi:cation:H+ antiporter